METFLSNSFPVLPSLPVYVLSSSSIFVSLLFLQAHKKCSRHGRQSLPSLLFSLSELSQLFLLFSKRSLLFRSCIDLVLPLPHRKKEKAAEHCLPVSPLFSPGGTLFFMAIMPFSKIRKEYHAQY